MTYPSHHVAPPRVVPPEPWLAVVRARPAAAILTLLSFGAAGIHFAVSPDHFAEWVPYGMAFACLAWFQLAWSAAYLLGPTRRLGLVAVVVNAAVVAVWVWSRTIGLPIGPEPGATEPVGFADALSSGLEAFLVVALLADARLTARLAGQPARWPVVAAVVAVLVVVATVAAMAALAPQPMSMG